MLNDQATITHHRSELPTPFSPYAAAFLGAASFLISHVMVITIALLLAAFAGAYVLIFGLNKRELAKSVSTSNENKVKKMYTKTEIASHNTRTDCWIIVKDKVYDVSSYVEEHPGGDAILAHAGDDSTEGFYGPQHATRVFDMIDEFYIGDLKQ